MSLRSIRATGYSTARPRESGDPERRIERMRCPNATASIRATLLRQFVTDHNMNIMIDFETRLVYIPHQPRSSRGASRGDPECGARRGVPRLRLVTVSPGRSGTPSARHYDLAARSSLHGSGGNAGDGSTGPRPKIATVERREARVSPLGDDKAPRKRLACRAKARSRASRTRFGTSRVPLHPSAVSALRHPSSGWMKGRVKPRAQRVAGTRR